MFGQNWVEYLHYIHTTHSSSSRNTTLVSYLPEWVKWFWQLPVVPQTLALPAASATGWCHLGKQVLQDALYALDEMGKEVVGEGDRGWAGRVGWGWGRVQVRKNREKGGRFCHDVVLFLTLDKIQLDVLSTAAWSCCVALRLALFVNPSLVRYEVIVQPMKPIDKHNLYLRIISLFLLSTLKCVGFFVLHKFSGHVPIRQALKMSDANHTHRPKLMIMTSNMNFAIFNLAIICINIISTW